MTNTANELSTNNFVEAEINYEQNILARNAWHLARYVIEHDHEIKIPEKFHPGQFFYWCENYPNLTCEEKIEFVEQYAKLEKVSKNVTARTLFATRIHGRGFFHAAFLTSVGRYLIFLSIVTITFVLLIASTLGSTTESKYFVTFWAAGLGTCVYLLRVTQEKLKTREFDPAFIPSQLIRLGLGLLAGGSIVLFPELFMGKGIDKVGIGQGSLAFVFGYAVDMFYSVLDNIGGRIKKRKT